MPVFQKNLQRMPSRVKVIMVISMTGDTHLNYIMYRIHDKSCQKIFQSFPGRNRPSTRQDAWEEAEELETPDERALLRQMVGKKYEPGAELDEREMRRLYGYLARRGFRSGDIFSVLEEMDITQKLLDIILKNS